MQMNPVFLTLPECPSYPPNRGCLARPVNLALTAFPAYPALTVFRVFLAKRQILF